MQTNLSDLAPTKTELRKFGILVGMMVAAIFGLLLPWLMDWSLPIWPWVVFGVMGLAGLFFPKVLAPVYSVWMRFALLLNRITTPILLGAVFFLLVTPIGLIMRLMGNDPMNRGFDADIKSYRVKSSATGKERLEKPY